MSSLKERTCPLCESAYQPTGPAQKYCPPCGEKRSDECKERSKKLSYEIAVGTGRIKNPGVGSGGNQWGEKNSQWKGGISPPQWRKWQKDSCERCESTAHLCVHHKDRNRKNNDPSNLETLCTSCHQREHEAWRNFYRFAHTRKDVFGAARKMKKLLRAFEGGVASRKDLRDRLPWIRDTVSKYVNLGLKLGWIEKVSPEEWPPQRERGHQRQFFRPTASAPLDMELAYGSIMLPIILAILEVYSSEETTRKDEDRRIA